jgi:hypothetical protein
VAGIKVFGSAHCYGALAMLLKVRYHFHGKG